jgi:hypothetical protein
LDFDVLCCWNSFLDTLGFQIIVTNHGNKYTLLALWLIAIAILISIGIKQASLLRRDSLVEKILI